MRVVSALVPSTASSVAAIPVMISSGVGRSVGSFERAACTSTRSASGKSGMSGSCSTTLYIRAAGAPSPNGDWPDVAKQTVQAHENTSLTGVVSAPWTCSGERKAGDPRTVPVVVTVVWSAARAMPKSTIRGPVSVRRMLLGFRSRWMTPAVWMSESAWAVPAAMASTELRSSGPSATASASDGPSTNSVAIHGWGASTSAARSRVVNGLCTRMPSSTSRRNRSRNVGSAASPGWMTLTAASSPASFWPR